MRILSFPLKRATASVVLVAFALATSGCGGGAYNPTAPTTVPSSSTPSATAAALSEASVSPPVVDDTIPVLDDSETFIKTNSFGTVVQYLPASILALLGWEVAIGVAVIAGGYLVYHISSTAWTYFKANSYSRFGPDVYGHANDFGNIWPSKPPTRKQLENQCKNVMNSRGSRQFVDSSNGRLIGYNPSLEMATVGETDGKTIVTCFRIKQSDVTSRLRSGRWLEVYSR